jgi:hypothetical protein
MSMNPRTIIVRPSFARRHKIITAMIALPAGVITLGITIALGVGFAGAVHDHTTNQITIERTDSAYQDCTAFATARGFALDVCEPLLPTSKAATASCATEIKYGIDPVDCPPTLKP